MRIAFLGTRGIPATYSGFETCVEQMGERMAAAGHEVLVFCRSGHYRDRPHATHGIRLIYLPAIPTKHLETISHTALSSVRISPEQAIICMGVGNAPVIRALELRGRCAVFNVDGADWQRLKWGRFARTYLRACERLASGGRSIVVADAKSVQRYYSATYGRLTELVPYGALAPADRGTETLSEFGLKAQAYLLFVGRLVPENGAHDFIEAARLAEVPWPAVVVGDAPYAREYIQGLHRSAAKSAVFTGYRFGRSYQQLSANAGLYVLAAQVGGTHPVLLEQMAAGNCILARDTQSNQEVLGTAGLFWKTPAELASLIKRLSCDPQLRQDLGRRAAQRAEANYNWDVITDRYIELCRASLRLAGVANT